MNRATTTSLLSALVILSTAACQREGTDVSEKLDEMNKRLVSIEAKIDKGGGAAAGRPQRPQRPRRPTPNPADTYAVNIAGAAFKGPQAAKVTIVEAFEFA